MEHPGEAAGFVGAVVQFLGLIVAPVAGIAVAMQSQRSGPEPSL